MMRRAAALALLLLVVAVPGAAGVPPQSESVAAAERAIQRQIDEIRRVHGLPPLRSNPALAAVARGHSRRMSQDGFFDHRDPEGTSVAERVRAAGVAYRIVGENIAEVQRAADPARAAVEGWMASAGHRANILRREFSETGVGVWREGQRVHLTQVFVRPG